ncbi:MAG: TlyA family RNA methyltransferase [Spirochaetales bacterium]|nr:TlyA family RNA methyltransferase [Spirochaetales bacterium]
MKQKKIPLLKYLTAKLTDYTEKELYSMIMCGEIKVGSETIKTPTFKVPIDSNISIKRKKWVSRGGEKLDYAIKSWDIKSDGKVVIDAGSSTGGFTDVLLQNNALLVYSVDVGFNQLDYSLRINDRVKVMEKTNIMSVKDLSPMPDFAVADLSFRSINGAASHVLKLTKDNLLIALIKPQFEIKETEGFDGIIRDRNIIEEVLKNTAVNLENERISVDAVLESPIKGGKGNTEFLFKLRIAEANEVVINLKKIEDFLKK